MHSKELYTVYRNDFSGMQDMNDTCDKKIHTKMIRGFTVMYTVTHARTRTLCVTVMSYTILYLCSAQVQYHV